jgi:uncharacterized membrane protein YhaH (DUF805 family)
MGSQPLAIGWLVYLTTMDAQNIRRYHDLGSSGSLYQLMRPLLVILPLIAFALQFLIPAQLASVGDMGALAFLMQQEVAFHMSPVPLAVMALWFVALVSNIVYLAVMPGQPGANTYGPAPGQGGGQGGGPGGGAFLSASGAASGDGDPVARALAEYKANLAKPQPPRATAVPARPGQAGATFGRKR